uniref:(northern house mosquito) hypothetical protein n=1 Tax=Culex pipiens TaxID=7175 RepID=A0A8D8CGB0_CULPI
MRLWKCWKVPKTDTLTVAWKIPTGSSNSTKTCSNDPGSLKKANGTPHREVNAREHFNSAPSANSRLTTREPLKPTWRSTIARSETLAEVGTASGATKSLKPKKHSTNTNGKSIGITCATRAASPSSRSLPWKRTGSVTPTFVSTSAITARWSTLRGRKCFFTPNRSI